MYIELLAVALALVYIVFAARSSNWCWPFGFVSSCLWAFQVWTAYDLLFDTILNVFYAAMAVAGFVRWQQGNEQQPTLRPITKLSWGQHAAWIAGGLVVTAVVSVLAKAYTSAALPVVDAFTTVGSVIGTILLIERRLSTWLYLIAMDVIYVWLYLDRGSPLFASLFVLYCVLAGYGYWAWRKEFHAQVTVFG